MKNQETETTKRCSLCGEEYPEERMVAMFTGRRKLICPACYAKGSQELYEKNAAFRDSAKGRAIIEQCKKKSRRGRGSH